MNKILFSCLILSAAAAMPGCGVSPSASASTAKRETKAAKDELPMGTLIRVKTAGPISARAVAPGERIAVAAAGEISLGGEVRVMPGTEAIVTAVEVNSSAIQLRLTELRFGLVEHTAVHTEPVTGAAEIPAGAELRFQLASPLRLKGRGQK